MPRLVFVDDQIVTAEQINALQSQTIRYYDTKEDRAAAYALTPPDPGECTMLLTDLDRVDYWTGIRWRPVTGRALDWIINTQPPHPVLPRPRVSAGPVHPNLRPSEDDEWTWGVPRQDTFAGINVVFRESAPQPDIGPDVVITGSGNYSTAEEAITAQNAAAQAAIGNNQIVRSRPPPVRRPGGRRQPGELVGMFLDYDTRALADAAAAAFKATCPPGSTFPTDVIYQIESDDPPGDPEIRTSPPGAFWATEPLAQTALDAAIAALPSSDQFIDSEILSRQARIVISTGVEVTGTPTTTTATESGGPYTTSPLAVAARDAAVAALPSGTTVVGSLPAVTYTAPDWGPPNDNWVTESSRTAPGADRNAVLRAARLAAAAVPAGSQFNPAAPGSLDRTLFNAEASVRPIAAVYGADRTETTSATAYATRTAAQAALNARVAALRAQGALVSVREVTERPRRLGATQNATGVESTTAQVNTAMSDAFASIGADAVVLRQEIKSEADPTIGGTPDFGFVNMFWGSRDPGTGQISIRSTGPDLSPRQAEITIRADDNRVEAAGLSRLAAAAATWMRGYAWPAFTELNSLVFVSTNPAEAAFGRRRTPWRLTSRASVSQGLAGAREVNIDSGNRTIDFYEGSEFRPVEVDNTPPERGVEAFYPESQTTQPLPMSIVADENFSLTTGEITGDRPAAIPTSELSWLTVVFFVPSKYRWNLQYKPQVAPPRFGYTITYQELVTPLRYFYEFQHRPLITADGYYYSFTTTTTTVGTTNLPTEIRTVFTWTMRVRDRLVEGKWRVEVSCLPPPVLAPDSWQWTLTVSTFAIVVVQPLVTTGPAFICSIPKRDGTGAEILVGLDVVRQQVREAALFSFDPEFSDASLFLTYRGNVKLEPSGAVNTNLVLGKNRMAACPDGSSLYYQVGLYTGSQGRQYALATLPDPPPLVYQRADETLLAPDVLSAGIALWGQNDPTAARRLITIDGVSINAPKFYELAESIGTGLLTKTQVGRWPPWDSRDPYGSGLEGVASWGEGIGEPSLSSPVTAGPRVRRIVALARNGTTHLVLPQTRPVGINTVIASSRVLTNDPPSGPDAVQIGIAAAGDHLYAMASVGGIGRFHTFSRKVAI